MEGAGFTIVDGNLHRNLKWARRSTIGHSAPCCDSRIIDVIRRPDYDG